MMLLNQDFEVLCNAAIHAAIGAGNIINKYKKNGFTIMTKEGGVSIASQVLTEVDIKCQEYILRELSPLQKKYDLGLLTEEEFDDSSRLVKEYFWAIDPMDGTKAFIDSDKGFSVSIALVHKTGQSVIGVVYDPVNDTIYSAIKGLGVYKNKNRWFPDLDKTSTRPIIIADPSFNKTKFEQLKVIEYGGAVMNALLILEGIGDLYIKLPKIVKGGGSIWDFAATSIIFMECGAVVTDIYGDFLFLNNPNTTFMNEKGIFFCRKLEGLKSLLNTNNT